MYDIAIVGAGPAGLSAAINADIRNQHTVVFAGREETTYLDKAPDIDNYLGFPNINGLELITRFRDHVAQHSDIEIKREKVVNIMPMGTSFMINANNVFYESRAIILAIGIPRTRFMPGEQEFIGKGVGYCATCDGPLYKGKTVAVISEEVSGQEEADYLAGICQKVYYIPLYKGPVEVNERVEVLNDKPVSIEGDEMVKALKLKNAVLTVDGIFVLRKVTPVDQLIRGLEMDKGIIRVDRDMETNIPGVYAAGDCTGEPYQVAKAVGEGTVAALAAARYVDRLKK